MDIAAGGCICPADSAGGDHRSDAATESSCYAKGAIPRVHGGLVRGNRGPAGLAYRREKFWRTAGAGWPQALVGGGHAPPEGHVRIGGRPAAPTDRGTHRRWRTTFWGDLDFRNRAGRGGRWVGSAHP